MTRKRVFALTGTRADYGLLRPVFAAIRKKEDLELVVAATGMHFMKDRGHTIDSVRQDFPEFGKLLELNFGFKDDSRASMAQFAGRLTSELAGIFSPESYDVALLLGDRVEMLAAAIAASYSGIAIAQIHGGELSGTIDDPARHAISRLAHLHFVTTERNGLRLRLWGEPSARVYVVGAPGLDTILNSELPSREDLRGRYSIPDGKYALVVQHPVTEEIGAAAEQMRATLDATLRSGLQTIVVYPNADAGGNQMIGVIKKYASRCAATFPSLPHADYLALMRDAAVLVGNSSSGIIEAASFKVPVVDIGTRQRGREHACNVIHATYDADHIASAIDVTQHGEGYRAALLSCTSPYGDGHAGERIARTLSEINFDGRMRDKQLFDPAGDIQ